MSGSSKHQQSGIASDDASLASLLWDQTIVSCDGLFPGYAPISIAMHSSDLISHIASVRHVIQQPGLIINDGLLPPPPLLPQSDALVGAMSLPGSYFEMGFVVQAFAMRSGCYLPMSTISTDPSFPFGSTESLRTLQKREQQALKEVEQTIQHSKTWSTVATIGIFIIEPLLVPGRGRTYRHDFLLALQTLLHELEVLLVADETISFVRCGSPLFLQTVPGFMPDLVIIGKSLGCSLLLLRQAPLYARTVNTLFANAFGLVAQSSILLQVCCILRLFLVTDVPNRCRQQGEAMLEVLRTVCGKRVRGVGYCLWVDEGLQRLPVTASIHGRLLPRLDQDADTLKWIIDKEAGVVEEFKTRNELEAARTPHCAICGDQCRSNEDRLTCVSCTRQYHDRCHGQARGRNERHCACTAAVLLTVRRSGSSSITL